MTKQQLKWLLSDTLGVLAIIAISLAPLFL
jgi:hypothetical protein